MSVPLPRPRPRLPGTGALHRLSLSLTRQAMLELGGVTAFCALLTALQAFRVDLFTESHVAFAEPGWDHHAYIAMASNNPFDFHLAPFGWRPLVPAFARALPFSLETSFFLIAFVALVATGVCLYYLAKAAGYGRWLGVAAVLLFQGLGWAVKFGLQDFWLPDATAFLAIAAATLFAARRQPVLFAATLAAGAMAKESVLFAAPLYYTLNAGRLLDWRLLWRAAAAVAPALVVALALRLAIPAQNGDAAYVATLSPTLQAFREFIPDYHYIDLLRDIGEARLHDHRSDTLLAYTSGTWGVGVLVLAALGAATKPMLALRLAPMIVLGYSQLLFALNIERLLVVAFPAMVWLSLEGIRGLLQVLRVPAAAAIVLAGGMMVLNLKDEALIPVSFELQTFVFAGCLVAVLALGIRRLMAPPPSG